MRTAGGGNSAETMSGIEVLSALAEPARRSLWHPVVARGSR